MSFLKKLIKKKDEEQRPNAGPPPTGVQTMSAELQLKYAKGVQYNMKVIIKGDRNVGKTTLFLRLQGQKFREEYLPTDEIQVANIQWSYKATDDVVKVEVWDVVDKARRKPTSEGSLKMRHEGTEEDLSPKLDAQFVDVYKGTHAVILMYDMTKMWTWKYVEQEIPKIPAHIPVVILANCRDMGLHRTVDVDTPGYFVSSLDRGEDAASVRFTEMSLLNGFGLKYLHAFFNVPFLALQRDTLLKQLEANTRETLTIHQELDILGEADYENILESVKLKKAGIKPESDVSSTSSDGALRPPPAQTPIIPTGNKGTKPSQSVDDFKPDAADASEFFNSEIKESPENQPSANQTTASDEEADDNPLVASIQDDLDSSDEEQTHTVPDSARPASAKLRSADVVLTSDEESKADEPAADSDSDSEPNTESSLSKLTQQFTQTVTVKQSEVKQSLSESDESSDEVEAPTILADEGVSSEEEKSKATFTLPTSKATFTKLSSKDVVLTDSDEDAPKAALASGDAVDSDEEPQPSVQLPDIAISHQAASSSSEHKAVKKKKKKKEKTINEGEENSKPKKKKKSKQADTDGSKERKKKSKSKTSASGGSKPPLDPLEQFLAGDSDGNDHQSSNYECL